MIVAVVFETESGAVFESKSSLDNKSRFDCVMTLGQR
jgi:hypothetical protein